jgi:[ribosomal protein S5]-alanine N-acetyltransferase
MGTVRLHLVEAGHANELIDANRASAALHHPWVQPFTDKAGFDAYFDSLDGQRKIGLLAREVSDQAPVGIFNLSEIIRGPFQNAYLGFYGLSGRTGRGLLTEALRAVLVYTFEALRLHRVEANIQPGNLRSINLVSRAGFRREGYSPRFLHINGDWRDHERWAILADEVQAREV